MRGRRGSRCLPPLLSSSSSSSVSLCVANASTLSPPARVGHSADARSAHALRVAARTLSTAAHDASTPAPPIQSTQDLHTTLLSFAHAAAAAAAAATTPTAPQAPLLIRTGQASSGQNVSEHRSNSSSNAESSLITTTAQNSLANETPNFVTSTESPLGSLSPSLPPVDAKHRLLQRLLLHRRHTRSRSSTTTTSSDGSRASLRASRHSSASLVAAALHSVEARWPQHASPSTPPASLATLDSQPHERRSTSPSQRSKAASTTATATAGATASTQHSGQASWARAFELFNEAVQQHHVSPTAQHFNLLLYIAQQHGLWSRMDAVEDFQAHLLASVQQLVAEKRKEERSRRRKEEEDARRGGRDEAGNAAGGAAAAKGSGRSTALSAATTSTTISLAAAPSQLRILASQIAELQEMEAALRPNAQTYELLLAAALTRGAWSRALEYCEMRTRSGVAALTDTSVRQVLQVYAVAENATDTLTPEKNQASLPASSSPLHRLRTDQQGPGLRAAAQPRRPISDTPSPTFLSLLTQPPPHWAVALAFFRSSLHRVSSMQTVEAMVALLQNAGQPKEVLQVLNEDCGALVRSCLRALAAGDVERWPPQERAAVHGCLQRLSDAAREVGDWQTAQQLLRDVVELRRQLSYAQIASAAGTAWGTAHTDSLSMPSSSAESTRHRISGEAVSVKPLAEMAKRDSGEVDSDAALQGELQLSQYILQNTLHTLRRVRRYPDMVRLYRTSPHQEGEASGTQTAAGELALVWQSVWTPQAIGFVAQAGLATGDLDLLLELCGLADLDDGSPVDSTDRLSSQSQPPQGAPADAYDAALRLLQSRILLHSARQESEGTRAAPPQSAAEKTSVRRYVALSQRVYAAYRRQALKASKEETSPYRQFLIRQRQVANSAGEKHPARLQLSSSSVLSEVHAPLVQLLAQSCEAATASAPSSSPPPSPARTLVQQAQAQFMRIRQPDTLAIALAMDVVCTQIMKEAAARPHSSTPPARRLTDAAAQSVVLAVQQIYDTVLEKAGLGSVQLATTPTYSSANQEVTDALPRHPLSEITLPQRTALSVVTSAAVLISFDALACAQPLALLRLIPFTTHLGWLPREMSAPQLQRAQQAVADWTAAHHPAATAQPPLMNSVQDEKKAAAARCLFAESSGAAVAHFAQLYAQLAMEPATPTHAFLAAAAHVIAELQRPTMGRPPTAAMTAFQHALQDFQRQRNGSSSSSSPETENAVVVSAVNAVIQQVGTSTVSRWTLWGACAELLDQYIASPLAAVLPDACHNGVKQNERMKTGATVETLQMLHTFLRLCDKAEAPFVEHVALRWLLRCLEDASPVPVAQTSERAPPSAGSTQNGVVTNSTEALCRLCLEEGPQSASRSMKGSPSPLRTEASSKRWTSTPLTDVQVEALLLLLDALTWACRRHDRNLARQLYTTLAPWIDDTLCAALPSRSAPFLCREQHERLRDAARSTYMTLLQCLSNGARSDVLRDWPMLHHVLRQLSIAEAQQVHALKSLASAASLRRTAVLIDGLAAVVVKLQRTLHFLVVELALNTHRARTQAHEPSAEDEKSEGGAAAHRRVPVVSPHQSTVEEAAEAFAQWCTLELLPELLIPSLRAAAESDATASSSVGKHQATLNVNAFLQASFDKVTQAVWELDFASFAWLTRFRPPDRTTSFTGCDPDAAFARRASSIRSRGYQLLTSQLCWSNSNDSVHLLKHFRLWLLFTGHALSTTPAVTSSNAAAQLCRDLTTLEALYTVRTPIRTSAALSSPQHTAGSSFLHAYIAQVDELTMAVLTRASTASMEEVLRHASSSRPPPAAPKALPRLPDGSAALDLLNKPFLHFTPAVLRVLQQAAQQVLYLSLCEGTTDVQYFHGDRRSPPHATAPPSPATSGGATANVSASLPLPPALLRRCLAWPGLPTAYPLLLQAIEAAAYETLREPAAIVDVFQQMTRLHSGEAAEAVLHERRHVHGAPHPAGSSVETFLTFYLSSPVLRRASPVNSQVCLAALLACASAAAAAASADAPTTIPAGAGVRSTGPPPELLTLLSAFPHVLSDGLFTQWQQRALPTRQEAVLRAWLLQLLWGGSKFCGAVASLQPYNTQSLVHYPLPLRRAALQWLVLTQGTLLPPPFSGLDATPHDDAEEAREVDAVARRHETSLGLLDGQAKVFAAVFCNAAAAWQTLQDSSKGVLRALLALPLASNPTEEYTSMVHGGAEERAAVQAVVGYCMTRHSVQQLLQRYTATSTLRGPVAPCAAEAEAFVAVLPPESQDAARKTMRDRAAHLEGSMRSASGKVEDVSKLIAGLGHKVDGQAPHVEAIVHQLGASLLPVMLPKSSEVAPKSWGTAHAKIAAAVRELLQAWQVSPSSLRDSESTASSFEASAARHFLPLRPIIESLIRGSEAARSALPSTPENAHLNRSAAVPAAADEASACVQVLLLYFCVHASMASPQRAAPPQAVGLLRREALHLLCSLTTDAMMSPTAYVQFVKRDLQPLLSVTALPTSAASVSTSPHIAVAHLEAFAAFGAILHHVAAAASLMAAGVDPASPGSGADCIEAAVALFQQSCDELVNLLSASCGGGGGLPDTAAPLLRTVLKTWTQAGVLLGEVSGVLSVAHQLTTTLIRRQQQRDVKAWTSAAAANHTASIASAEGKVAKVVVEWLEVVPVAAAVVESAVATISSSHAAGRGVNDGVRSLVSILPQLRRGKDASQLSSAAYLSLLQLWQKHFQLAISQTANRAAGRHQATRSSSSKASREERHQLYVDHLVCAQPFAVVFQLPHATQAPTDLSHKATSSGALDIDDSRNRMTNLVSCAQHVRDIVASYLAGPPHVYPRLHPTTYPRTTTPLRNATRTPGPTPPLTAETLHAAVRCVTEATPADMKTFTQLESTRLSAATTLKRLAATGDAKQLERGQAVQRAWHRLQRAAHQHRQQRLTYQQKQQKQQEEDTQCANGPAPSPSSLLPLSEWMVVFNSPSVAIVPHTVHFIPTAVSEVLMLESCRDWSEGLAVLQHSLRTLTKSGATPVQQYMAQLLLQRVRTTSGLSSFTKRERGGGELSKDFSARLAEFTYTAPALQNSPSTTAAADDVLSTKVENQGPQYVRQRWSQYLAGRIVHGPAALACRTVDLLLISYDGRATSSSASGPSPLIAQHTLIEALRCSVSDVAATRALFWLFWTQHYLRIEGAHAFLSALRAAKVAREEGFAVHSMLLYAWVTTPGPAQRRREDWEACVKPLLRAHGDEESTRSLVAAVREAQSLTEDMYQLSPEAHRAVWKSWTTLCRMGIVCESAALFVISVFKALDRVSEVEELLVTTCYAKT